MEPLIISKQALAELSVNPEDYPSGIIIPIDKPYRWTSTDVVRRIKFALRRRWGLKNVKVGHAGTLDPLATGILIVCIGKATKIAESLQAERKEYIAQFTLGATTPSYDREHPINEVFDTSRITIDRIREAVSGLVGKFDQVPPAFSAKYVNGKRSYDLVRSGQEVELKPSKVEIYSAELIGCRNIAGGGDFALPIAEIESPECGAPSYGSDSAHDFFTVKKWKARADNNYELEKEDVSDALLSPQEVSALPVITVRIACSKGTYIRSIARDLGLELCGGAYMSSLRRVASGGFKIENSVTFDESLRIIPELSPQSTHN